MLGYYPIPIENVYALEIENFWNFKKLVNSLKGLYCVRRNILGHNLCGFLEYLYSSQCITEWKWMYFRFFITDYGFTCKDKLLLELYVQFLHWLSNKFLTGI